MGFKELFIDSTVEEEQELPLFKEMAINFDTGDLLTKDNEVIVLTGNEALKVWIWKSLLTERNKYRAYSSSFGNDLKKEIGFVYDRTIKEQLLFSEIQDSLLVNPYIVNVYNFTTESDPESGKVKVFFNVTTVYGELLQEVQNVNL